MKLLRPVREAVSETGAGRTKGGNAAYDLCFVASGLYDTTFVPGRARASSTP